MTKAMPNEMGTDMRELDTDASGGNGAAAHLRRPRRPRAEDGHDPATPAEASTFGGRRVKPVNGRTAGGRVRSIAKKPDPAMDEWGAEIEIDRDAIAALERAGLPDAEPTVQMP